MQRLRAPWDAIVTIAPCEVSTAVARKTLRPRRRCCDLASSLVSCSLTTLYLFIFAFFYVPFIIQYEFDSRHR